MRTKTVITVIALCISLYGLLFLAIPGFLLDMRGLEANDSSLLTSRLMGSYSFCLGLLGWFSRNFKEGSALKSTSLVLFAATLLSALIIGVFMANTISPEPAIWVDLFLTVVMSLLLLKPAFTSQVDQPIGN